MALMSIQTKENEIIENKENKGVNENKTPKKKVQAIHPKGKKKNDCEYVFCKHRAYFADNYT